MNNEGMNILKATSDTTNNCPRLFLFIENSPTISFNSLPK